MLASLKYNVVQEKLLKMYREKHFFENLQELRGMAALLIVISHIPLFKKMIGPSFGGYGVAIFFLLSGFLVAYSTQNGNKLFLTKRSIRIIPVYYLMTVLTYILVSIKPSLFNTTTANPIYLAKSLLFIPYVNPNGIVRPILDVAWALLPEVWLYLLYWIVMKVSHKYRNEIVAIILFLIFLLGEIFLKSNPIYSQYRFSCLTFTIGILIYLVWLSSNNEKKVVAKSKWKWILCSLLFWSAGVAYNYSIQFGLDAISLLLPVLVFVCYLVNDSAIYNSKMIMRVATFSYSLYLSHEFVVKGFSRLLFSLNEVTVENVLLSGICIFIAVIVGFVLNCFFEKPATNFLTNLFIKNEKNKD